MKYSLLDTANDPVCQPVLLAAFGAGGQVVLVEMQLMAVLTHPTYLACGVTNNQRIGRNSMCYNRPGANECIFAYIVSANNSSIRTNAGTFTYICFCVLAAPVNSTSRIGYICKYTRRPKKNIISASYTGIDGYVVLDLYIVS